MYKVGDEVLIKGEVIEVMSNVPYPTKVKIGKDEDAYLFSNDEICFADKIVKTYEMGLNDAWELAKKIYTLKPDEREKMLGYQSMKAILEDLSAEYVADRIEAYEKEKEIKPTDIVEYNGKNWVVTEVYKGEYSLWNGKNVVHTANVKKVGSVESIKPLEELLRQIGE